jgi:sulfate adenylyltransferase subunit 2
MTLAPHKNSVAATALAHRPVTAAALTLDHLDHLEAEAIHIFREVAGEFERPVVLFSGGKDSVLMLHLAVKAFAPASPPFALLHVDTGHNFPEVLDYRDETVARLGLRLVVARVQDYLDDGRLRERPDGTRNPLQTVPLLDAIEANRFDAVFGGGRRDEEKARAKERVFSLRDAFGAWDPRRQRPELWDLYNGRHAPGEHVRVFPLSNWTELDVWQYIYLENIPIVPLYFAQSRPVVVRDGVLIMVDDDRMPLGPGERPAMKRVRFRTLGCYPLTGAIESNADTLTAIIQEMLLAKTSERQGRVIDHDSTGSMEKKKQEGYF